MRVLYLVLPVLLLAAVFRLLGSERLDFSLVLVIVVAIAGTIWLLDHLLLAPPRDLLSMAVMLCAFLGENVAWQGQVLSTAPDRALTQTRDIYAAQRPALAHGEG